MWLVVTIGPTKKQNKKPRRTRILVLQGGVGHGEGSN